MMKKLGDWTTGIVTKITDADKMVTQAVTDASTANQRAETAEIHDTVRQDGNPAAAPASRSLSEGLAVPAAKRRLGAWYGLAVGDALGAPF